MNYTNYESGTNSARFMNTKGNYLNLNEYFETRNDVEMM